MGGLLASRFEQIKMAIISLQLLYHIESAVAYCNLDFPSRPIPASGPQEARYNGEHMLGNPVPSRVILNNESLHQK